MDEYDLMILAASVSFALSLTALIFLIRSRRIQRWKVILSQPGSQAAAETAEWRKLLPADISLASEAPLFNILFEAFRSRPNLFLPAGLSKALAEAKPLPAQIGAEFKLAIASDEELYQLFGMRTYQQNPDYIPVDALTSNLIRNLLSVLTGKKKLRVGLEHALLDSLGAGGGFAGAKLGSLVGLVVAPLITPLITPLASWAAAVIIPTFVLIGAWLGSLAARQLAAKARFRKIHAELKRLRAAAKTFRSTFLLRFPELMKSLEDDYRARIHATHEMRRKRQNPLSRYFYPDLLTIFFNETVARLTAECTDEINRWKSIRWKVRFTSPLEFVPILHKLTDGRFLGDDELQKYYLEYAAALKSLEEAKKTVA